jgi:16S rRNA (guanine1516-N2)-methyltransferase
LQPKLVEKNSKKWIEFPNGEALKIDFLKEPGRYFHRKHRGKNELIAKAIGISKGYFDVWDATLGLGEDAIFLATLGFKVRASERNPMLFELLRAAFNLADMARGYDEVLKRIEIFPGDSIELLKAMPEAKRPQVVYMDPMFPEKKKSALPRKEMRLFRELVGEDPDSNELFKIAMSVAKERVVVKRPLRAPEIATGVIHRFEGQTVRYDIYRPSGSATKEIINGE